MAVPKRRVSKQRRDNRRAHWKLVLPGLVACPQCHEANCHIEYVVHAVSIKVEK